VHARDALWLAAPQQEAAAGSRTGGLAWPWGQPLRMPAAAGVRNAPAARFVRDASTALAE
jgi:hypothetical protein